MKNIKNSLIALLIAFALCVAFALPLQVNAGNGNSNAQAPLTGKTLKNHREQQGVNRPQWADTAHRHAKDFLRLRLGKAWDLNDPETELNLLSVDEDDLGYTHVKHDQVFNGVSVFGGQIITQVITTKLNVAAAANLIGNLSKSELVASVMHTFGRIHPDARQVDTNPQISINRAIRIAKETLGYGGTFAKDPAARRAKRR